MRVSRVVNLWDTISKGYILIILKTLLTFKFSEQLYSQEVSLNILKQISCKHLGNLRNNIFVNVR